MSPRRRMDTDTPQARGLSITLDKETLEMVDARDSGGRSATIRRMLGWYAAIVELERPELSEGEWSAIRDVLNGTFLAVEPGALRMMAGALAIEVDDALPDGLAEKWHVDGGALVTRLSEMSFSERVAVIDDAIRFWNGVARDGVGDAVVVSCEPNDDEPGLVNAERKTGRG